jgi:hypothetical protein
MSVLPLEELSDYQGSNYPKQSENAMNLKDF